MTTNLMVELLVRYVVAGIIGWIVWFIVSMSYVLIETRFSLSLLDKCKNLAIGDADEANRKTQGIGYLFKALAFWPIEVMRNTLLLGRILKKATETNN